MTGHFSYFHESTKNLPEKTTAFNLLFLGNKFEHLESLSKHSLLLFSICISFHFSVHVALRILLNICSPYVCLTVFQNHNTIEENIR